MKKIVDERQKRRYDTSGDGESYQPKSHISQGPEDTNDLLASVKRKSEMALRDVGLPGSAEAQKRKRKRNRQKK